MALFGGADGLVLRVSESGTDQVAGKLGRLSGAVDRVGQRGAGVWTRMRSGLASVQRIATGLLGMFGRIGGMLGIGGIFAFSGLIKETLDVERGFSRIRFQAGLTGAEMGRLRGLMNQIAGSTGKSRGELLGAVDAALDFGIPLEEAQKSLEKAVLWADLLGVSTDQALGAVGAVKRAVGEAASVEEIMAALNAAATGIEGMDEAQVLAMVQKIAPQLQGVRGLSDITVFLQDLASIGDQFEPRQIATVFKTLNKASGEDLKKWGRFGVEGATAAERLLSISQILAKDEDALDRAGLSEDVILLARAMANNREPFETMGTKVTTALGSVDAFGKQLEEHKNDPEVAWAGTMEQLKIAMQPLIEGLLGWVRDHKGEIVAGIQAFVEALQKIVSWVADKIGDLEEVFRGPAESTRLKQNPIDTYRENRWIAGIEKNYPQLAETARALQRGARTEHRRTTLEDLVTWATRSQSTGGEGERYLRDVSGAGGTPTNPPMRVLVEIRTPDGVEATANAEQDGRRVPVTGDVRYRSGSRAY